VAAVVAVAVVAAVLAAAALASWVRELAVQAALLVLLVQEMAAEVGLVAQPEVITPVELTVAELGAQLQTQARVAAAPSVLFGPAQTYLLARFHQQTQGMYK
jgi:hypothetical protein